jgi:hypothetical protein
MGGGGRGRGMGGEGGGVEEGTCDGVNIDDTACWRAGTSAGGQVFEYISCNDVSVSVAVMYPNTAPQMHLKAIWFLW